MSTNNTSRLLNTADAADLLGFKTCTLEGWRLRGTGPRYLKLGYSVRYKESDLMKWAEKNSCKSTSEYDTSYLKKGATA